MARASSKPVKPGGLPLERLAHAGASSRALPDAESRLPLLQERVMVKRIVPIRFISFCLLVAGEALCQSELPSADFRQRDHSNSPEAPREEMRTWRSVPDAPPTVQPPKQADEF